MIKGKKNQPILGLFSKIQEAQESQKISFIGAKK